MSGHSKWATTKHKKAVIDARRGKLFAKLIKNIEVAARTGGGDPDGIRPSTTRSRRHARPRCRWTTSNVRSSGIRRRTGRRRLANDHVRGYGPNGVAFLIECLTDNRNRAASDVRVAMTRNGGSMADPGSVSYMFTRKGVVIVPLVDGLSDDDVLLAVLEAGAEEVNNLGEAFEVVSEATDLVEVRTALQSAGIDYDSADPTFLPSVTVDLDEDGARKVFRLIEALEDLDDVQNVYANYDVSDDVMELVG